MKNNIIEVLVYLAENKFGYLAYAVPLFILVVIFYLINKKILIENTKSFIQWLKPGFEIGGTCSAEKVTAVWLLITTYTPGRLYFSFNATDPIHLLWGSVLDATFILVVYGIVKPQQLIDLKNGSPREVKEVENLDVKI